MTIVDVARAAGVSHSTVSRALNGRPQISEATRQAVREAAEALGYVADLRGRGLAGGRSGAVGLVVPDLRSQPILRLVRAIDDALAAHAQNLMVCTTRGREDSIAEYVTQLSMGAVDGLILILPDAEAITAALDRRKVPYLLLDYDDAELTGVRRASATTGQDAVRVLLERIEAIGD